MSRGNPDGERILLGHGSGGRLTQELVAEHFMPHLANDALSALLDSAVLGDIALTTDAYVVTPRFFPGGDLGRLAVCGTVNDLCVVGARPIGLSAAFILEEGLHVREVDRLAASMAAAAHEAGVKVVAGDTKVVPRGACDGVFITTSGVGRMPSGAHPEPRRVVPGDAVLISGTIGDHGMAVMACREGLGISGDLRSDVAPLNALTTGLRTDGIDVHAMRDPTRGGLAQSVLEVASAAGVRVILEESQIPVRGSVRAACELLGIDPLYVANEGKLLLFVSDEHARAALSSMRGHAIGAEAAIIGRIERGPAGCEVHTAIGGRRSVRMASGELLPRIC